MRLSKARKADLDAMMKDTIFDAAGSLLEERGTDGLTMDRVATKVGVATASLYNYFRDKNELLQYTYRRIVEPYFEAIEEVAGANMMSAQKLARIVQTALKFAVRHKGLLVLLAGMGYEPEMKAACRPRFLQILNSVFEQGIHKGSCHPLDATDMSRMLLGCLSELFDMQTSGAPESEVKRFADTLIDVIFNGMHTGKSSARDEAKTHVTTPLQFGEDAPCWSRREGSVRKSSLVQP